VTARFVSRFALGRRPGFGLALTLAVLATTACKRESARGGAPAPSSAGPIVLPPLAAESWMVPLSSPAANAALAAVPLGARGPRPIVLALHGDAARPEWACGSYRHASSGRGFVVCPRGQPLADGTRFSLASLEQSRSELRAALRALKQRFGQHVASGSVVLAATGASVAAAIEIALEEPSFFSHLVLVDGSLERFTSGVVARFAGAGGRRVLVVRTGPSSAGEQDEKRLRALERAGVETRRIHVERASGLDGATTEALREAWPWLVRGDSRWD